MQKSKSKLLTLHGSSVYSVHQTIKNIHPINISGHKNWLNLAPWVTNGKDFNKLFTCKNYWTYSNSYHHLMSLMDMTFWPYNFKWHLNNRVERVNSDIDNLRSTRGGEVPVWVQQTIYLMLFGIVVWLRKCSYRKFAGSVHSHDCLKDGL